jgi:hypothetical protein
MLDELWEFDAFIRKELSYLMNYLDVGMYVCWG